MNTFTKILVSFMFLLSFEQSVLGDDRSPVFDMRTPQNDLNISHLKCGQFLDLLHSKDLSVVDVMIWIHGFVTGLDKKMPPFNDNFLAGGIAIVSAGCNDKNKPLVQAILDGKDLAISKLRDQSK